VAPHTKAVPPQAGWLFSFKGMRPPVFLNDIAAIELSIQSLAKNFSQVIVLADSQSAIHCVTQLNLQNLHSNSACVSFLDGEEHKNISTCEILWQQFAELRTDRNALVINVGGGVVTDLGGFVAATYNRGVNFIDVPTSLLGMTDAAIGGKTGVDLGALKNLVGVFAEPLAIFICPQFLQTLPFAELKSGFAEMLKHGLIADEKHWHELIHLNDNLDGIEKFIERSARIKYQIVSHDPQEKGERKLLNFGHTFGHAIESFFLKHNSSIKHGEAVALGMMVETHLSCLKNLLDIFQKDSILQTLGKFFEREMMHDISFDDVVVFMHSDKKNKNGKLMLTLLKKIGEGVVDVHCTTEECREAFELSRQ